ncbi:hypothetical protein STEG23_007923 [Scotinomys teguina]
MQPGRTTNTGGGTMEVVAAAPRYQLLLSVLMAVMLLPGMKGSPLLVQRTVTRTIVLQETIGKVRTSSTILNSHSDTAEKNNDIVKFAGKWMDLENVILSKIDATEALHLIGGSCHSVKNLIHQT